MQLSIEFSDEFINKSLVKVKRFVGNLTDPFEYTEHMQV